MKQDSEPPKAIALRFDRRLRVAGETVTGFVDLYFPSLSAENYKEVEAQLNGYIGFKRMNNSNFKLDTYDYDDTDHVGATLLDFKCTLWKHGTAYPPAGTHILSLPFRFELPEHIPPSYAHSNGRWRAAVKYSLDVIGHRKGFRFSYQLREKLSILSCDVAGARLHSALASGSWSRSWKKLEAQKDIRRGLWGEFTHVLATLKLPDVPAYPVETRVPFTLQVTTLSKLIDPEDKIEGASIFPPLPLHPPDLEFRLECTTSANAKDFVESDRRQLVTYLGGFGPSSATDFSKNVKVEVQDKVWKPSHEHADEKEQTGRCERGVRFTASFILKCAPSFETAALNIKYFARFKVAFPGVGNNLMFDFPMQIVSHKAPRMNPPQYDDPLPLYHAAVEPSKRRL